MPVTISAMGIYTGKHNNLDFQQKEIFLFDGWSLSFETKCHCITAV